MTHHMSTDADSRPTFTCTAPGDAACHVWADCLSEDGCESGNPECKHERVQHDQCILSEWYARPEDTTSMYLDEHGDYDVTPPANVESARIVIEWDECPLWSFDPLWPVRTDGSAL